MYQSHTGISVNADLHVKIQMHHIEICNFTLIFAIDVISAFLGIAIFHVNTQAIIFFIFVLAFGKLMHIFCSQKLISELGSVSNEQPLNELTCALHLRKNVSVSNISITMFNLS